MCDLGIFWPIFPIFGLFCQFYPRKWTLDKKIINKSCWPMSVLHFDQILCMQVDICGHRDTQQGENSSARQDFRPIWPFFTKFIRLFAKIHKNKVVPLRKSDLGTKFHLFWTMYVVTAPSEREKNQLRHQIFCTFCHFSPRSCHILRNHIYSVVLL